MEYTQFRPEDNQSIRRFFASAKSILSHSDSYSRDTVATALNESWKSYASGIDFKSLNAKSKTTLETMMKNYPGFRPINESGSDAVTPAKGKGLPQGNAAGQMPKSKSPKFAELDSKNDLIKRKPKSNLDSTPEIAGTGVGYDGKGKAPRMEALAKQDPILMENVAKLTRYIRKQISEAANGDIKSGSFALLVREDQDIAKTPTRYSLAEAIADAEELLLFHRPENVRMVVNYTTNRGKSGKTQIDMLPIKAREPIFNEDKALFRFQRNAEIFARELAAEGITSRIGQHNWGCSLMAESKNSIVKGVFQRMIV